MKLQSRLFTLILASIALVTFLGCGDESIILDQVLQEKPEYISPYTGGLIPVSNVKNFGREIRLALALEWNGEKLYMIANHGKYQSERQYLFTVDRETGIAYFVSGAKNFGGTFEQGRSFTQVRHTWPVDLAWIPEKKLMLAPCPILDSIVSIDLKTGLAGRISWDDDFCLRMPEGHRDAGYPVIGGSVALAWTGEELYMWGESLRGGRDRKEGYNSFGHLYKISNDFKCATPVGIPPYLNEPADHPYTTADAFDRVSAVSLTFDGEYLYLSDKYNHSLNIIDPHTGKVYMINQWYMVKMPEGYRKSTINPGSLYHIETNSEASFYVTGLAYDGFDMYAVDQWTNILYKLERR